MKLKETEKQTLKDLVNDMYAIVLGSATKVQNANTNNHGLNNLLIKRIKQVWKKHGIVILMKML